MIMENETYKIQVKKWKLYIEKHEDGQYVDCASTVFLISFVWFIVFFRFFLRFSCFLFSDVALILHCCLKDLYMYNMDLALAPLFLAHPTCTSARQNWHCRLHGVWFRWCFGSLEDCRRLGRPKNNYKKKTTSWWLQAVWKTLVKLDHFPRGENSIDKIFANIKYTTFFFAPDPPPSAPRAFADRRRERTAPSS